MDELPEDARRLLEEARLATTPSAAARARVWTALEAQLGGGGAPPAAGGGMASVLLVSVIVGIVGTVAGVLSIPRAEPPVPVIVAAPTIAPVAAQVEAPEEAAPVPVTERRVAPRVAPEEDIAADVALLSRAQAAWRSGRAGEALRLAEEHRTRFPGSAFGKERDAIRVLTLCALGREDAAKRIAARLLASSRGSPWRQAVAESCGGR